MCVALWRLSPIMTFVAYIVCRSIQNTVKEFNIADFYFSPNLCNLQSCSIFLKKSSHTFHFSICTKPLINNEQILCHRVLKLKPNATSQCCCWRELSAVSSRQRIGKRKIRKWRPFPKLYCCEFLRCCFVYELKIIALGTQIIPEKVNVTHIICPV